MSQDFKFSFDRMRENNPTGPEGELKSSSVIDTSYPVHGHIRNLCFAWPDGRMVFLNYSYLVSAAFTPLTASITLVFTTHEVLLKGIRLELLLDLLMSQFPRIIEAREMRYNSLLQLGEYAVNEIVVQQL